jgi:phosphoglycerate dehydrogenase-like enzyme
MENKFTVAILDDYQQAAFKWADWSQLQVKVDITIFSDHIFEPAALIERLKPFDVICVMRERTPLTKKIIASLPNLKLIVSTGRRNASIDYEAAALHNVEVSNTGYIGTGAPELTWALLMAIARDIPKENTSLRAGGWQTGVGIDLDGKTIGIVGLGGIGKKIAAIAKAFNMKVIAWSTNLTEEKATEGGAVLVTKETLFKEADFITVHLVLSERSKAIIGAADFALMKPTAYFINTSRGPLVDEQSLIDVLQNSKIAGAALDVFDQEPLPASHPFRSLPNVLATPHIGFVTEHTYKVFFEDTVRIIEGWIEKHNKNIPITN